MRDVLAAVPLLLLACTALAAPTPVNFNPGSSCIVKVYASNSLNSRNTAITRTVVVVHGSGLTADGYYDSVWSAAGSAGVRSSTLVLAPRFSDSSSGGRCQWSSGWRDGNLSQNGSPRVSSYAVLDALIDHVATSGNWPNLQKIVVTGHSAGGQVVGRYAMATDIPQAATIRFVPLNPSSWAYLVPQRPVTNSTTSFAIPSSKCGGSYDMWKYGLAGDFNSYVGAVGATAIREQFGTREVVYFLGTQDNNPNDSDLDTSCEAMRQGPHRLARGQAYFNHLPLQYGGIPPRHTLRTTSCSHSSSCMYRSSTGQDILFR
jgi:hypothetical protein